MDTFSEIRAKSISYLSFKIDKELFATHVMHVKNIIEVPYITKVPKMPDYYVGVINLRGDVLPVIDIHLKFGLGATQFTTNTCIVILEVRYKSKIIEVGALVDSVQEVLEFEDKVILDPPKMGEKANIEFITGIVKKDEELIMLLDMNMLLDKDEIENISGQLKSINENLEVEVNK